MADQEIDNERVRNIRQLLEAEGQAAVEHRFGPEALNTEEGRAAQQQADKVRARHRSEAERRIADSEREQRSSGSAHERAEAERIARAERAAAEQSGRQAQAQEAGRRPAQSGARTGQQAGGDARQQQAQERVDTVRRQMAAADERRREKGELAGQGRGQSR